jgi:hypothetical protein
MWQWRGLSVWGIVQLVFEIDCCYENSVETCSEIVRAAQIVES